MSIPPGNEQQTVLTAIPTGSENASRSSTTVYVSPTSETDPTSTPVQEPTLSGRRKRSVADSDDEEGEPQKRFKGSEGELFGCIDSASSLTGSDGRHRYLGGD